MILELTGRLSPALLAAHQPRDLPNAGRHVAHKGHLPAAQRRPLHITRLDRSERAEIRDIGLAGFWSQHAGQRPRADKLPGL